MICTCNRDHVNDDEHAPTCAVVLSAELAQLRADRDEARKLCEEGLTWLMSRCSVCGHRLRSDMPASHCPQCRAKAPPPWKEPSEYPDTCGCERCTKARADTDASGALEREGRKP